MSNRICILCWLYRLGRCCLAAVIVCVPAADALAQTYGAQQAVRRSVDNLGGGAQAAEQGGGASATAAVSYQRDVLPVLRANCHGCHRPDKTSGGLDMTVIANLMTGGESGSPAVVPGDPDASYLVQQITSENGQAAMPPRKRPLAATQVALIRRWIEQGAQDDSTPGDVSGGGTPRDPYRGAYREDRSAPYGTESPTSGMIDTTYVAPTAIAVVAFRPAQIMADPAAEMLPKEVLTAAGGEYLGFDPAGVEEVVAFVGQINMLQPANTDYGLAIKFASQFRAVSIKREIRAHAQLSELAGKRYLQNKSPVPVLPSFYGPDNRTLVIAPDATLRRLVESQGQPKTGAMIERVQAVPAGSDLYLAVDIASLRPFIEMGVAQAQTSGKLPPQAQELLELPKLMSAVELSFSITQAGPIQLVLHANDEAAAEKLEATLAAASGQGAGPSAERYAAGQSEGEGPVAMAMSQYVERVSQPFRPQRVGTTVTLMNVDAQNPMHRQLSSLAVAGVQFAIQAGHAAAQQASAAAAASASAEGAESAAAAEAADAGEFGDPATPGETPPPTESRRR